MDTTVISMDRLRVAATRLRGGTREDLPAIFRLLQRASDRDGAPRIDRHELEDMIDRGQLIVLQVRAGEVAAAVCVTSGRGIAFLTIDPEVASPELEHRMIAVADALWESEHPALCVRKRHGYRGRR
jgi:hypothetical protein